MTATTPRISIVVATANRPTLRRALRSCRWADEVLVVFDAEEPPWHPPGCVVLAHGPTRVWGHPQRNVGIQAATGTHVAFMDDDDLYTRGAGDLIRAALAASPDRVHVFCMRNRDKIYRGPVESGKIGTPMFVVPIEPVGTWTTRYAGDLDFITETMRLRGDEPVFHPEVIANINPPTLRSALRAAARPASWKRVANRVWRRLPPRRRAP